MYFPSYWIKASRPKTLIASLIPVLVGASNYLGNNEINQVSIFVVCGCLMFIFLIQISTNLANDFFDSKTGADLYRVNAPERFVSSGKIEGSKVMIVVITLLVISLIVGTITLLVASASVWFFLLGIFCISLTILYTGGPYPIAYNGLGDIFVILFFGLVAVEGTNYLLCSANSVGYETHIGSALAVGFLVNNLLIVNNYRDHENDSRVGKNTTIVLLGKKFGISFFAIGFLFPIFYGYLSGNLLVTLILIPSVLSYIFLFKSDQFKYANLSLAFSALSVLVYGTVTIMHQLSFF